MQRQATETAEVSHAAYFDSICDVSAVAITWENTAWTTKYVKVGAMQVVKS